MALLILATCLVEHEEVYSGLVNAVTAIPTEGRTIFSAVIHLNGLIASAACTDEVSCNSFFDGDGS